VLVKHHVLHYAGIIFSVYLDYKLMGLGVTLYNSYNAGFEGLKI